MNSPDQDDGLLLRTARLTLRRFTSADLDCLVELDSDPEVMRFLSGGKATSRELIESEILPRFLRYEEPFGGCGCWAAIENATGAFIGWFGLQGDEAKPDQLELGFRLRRAAWNKGYGTEGASSLVRWAFTETSVARVVAITYEDNASSQRVLTKVGLVPVRRFRMTAEQLDAVGTFDTSAAAPWEGDDIEYAIERDVWEQREVAPT